MCLGFETEEQNRPEFKGVPQHSLASDKDEQWIDEKVYVLKQTGSAGAITTLVGIVIAAVVGIFAFRFALERTEGTLVFATYSVIIV